jgi:drug/metabolite transporter (DMT)-like permease
VEHRGPGRTNLAIGLMLFGILLFSLNDLMGKWLVGTYPPAQVVLIRSVAALALLLPLMLRDGLRSAVEVDRPGLHALRVLFSTVDVICFYTAVVYLPLADVMAFYLAAPIFVAAMSPFLLGETVGWRRWTAIAVGFVGVLIALDPSPSSLQWPALLALLGSAMFSLLTVSTRALGAAPDKVLVLWQTVGALLGLVSMSAYFCVNRSLKLAPAATVAPYQYTLIVWAILFGYPVFGDVPSPHMLIGAGIIIAAGLFIFWREQVRNARQSRALEI